MNPEMKRILATADVPLRLGTGALTLDGVRFCPELAGEGFVLNLDSVRTTVLQRDYGTCRGCGFRSARYQEIVCAGPNARDLDGFVTMCIFCVQCFRLERVGEMKSAVLVRLPNIRQVELHWMLRELYVARSIAKTFDRAAAALKNLLARSASVVDLLHTDSPAELANMLETSIRNDARAELDRRIEDIRLMPLNRFYAWAGNTSWARPLDYDMFPQILHYWRSRQGPLAYVTQTGSLPWLSLLEERLAELASW